MGRGGERVWVEGVWGAGGGGTSRLRIQIRKSDRFMKKCGECAGRGLTERVMGCGRCWGIHLGHSYDVMLPCVAFSAYILTGADTHTHTRTHARTHARTHTHTHTHTNTHTRTFLLP